MARLIGHQVAVAGAIGQVDSTQLNPLGTRAFDDSNYEYIYLQGVASTAAGDFVVFSQSAFTTARLVTSTAAVGAIAVATAAVVASTYGWYLVDGVYSAANVATHSAGAGQALYVSSSAGRATTTAANALQIDNALTTGDATSNLGGIQVKHPFATGVTGVVS